MSHGTAVISGHRCGAVRGSAGGHVVMDGSEEAMGDSAPAGLYNIFVQCVELL